MNCYRMELFTELDPYNESEHQEPIFYDDLSLEDTDKYLNLDDNKHENQRAPIQHKIKKNTAQRDYKKNICRNLLRQAIKSMNRGPQLIFLQNKLKEDTNGFIDYYQNQFQLMNGFRSLKKKLLDKEQQHFKDYMNWFLSRRVTLFILNGESNNLKEHLRYKNEVMLFYTQLPALWCSNEPVWKKQTGN